MAELCSRFQAATSLLVTCFVCFTFADKEPLFPYWLPSPAASNRIVRSWDDAFDSLSTYWDSPALSREEFLTSAPFITTPFTIVAALRLALGDDDAYARRTEGIVVHLAGFAPVEGLSHPEYFETVGLYMHALLPLVESVAIDLVGPEVLPNRPHAVDDGWLVVNSFPGSTYDEFLASGHWAEPTVWIAETVGLHDADWVRDGPSVKCTHGRDAVGVTRQRTPTCNRAMIATGSPSSETCDDDDDDDDLPNACQWLGTFLKLREAHPELPLFVTNPCISEHEASYRLLGDVAGFHLAAEMENPFRQVSGAAWVLTKDSQTGRTLKKHLIKDVGRLGGGVSRSSVINGFREELFVKNLFLLGLRARTDADASTSPPLGQHQRTRPQTKKKKRNSRKKRSASPSPKKPPTSTEL